MRRLVSSFVLICALSGAEVRSQFVGRSQYIGPGSTPQGDYLRGLGVAATGFGNFYAGVGNYNLNTAQAGSINADTAMRVDTYLAGVFRAARDNYQLIRRQERERAKETYSKDQKRKRENPEDLDVMTGNALNAILDQLNDPQIQPSSFRSIPVTVPVDMIRKIPLKLDESGLIFSIQRMTRKGRGKWETALQDPKFDLERQALEKAMDRALERMIERRMTEATIEDYKAAVQSLDSKLDREFGPNNRERHYNEAKTRLREMLHFAEILKTYKMQSVLADFDKYGGTTVDDLRQLMHAHGLRFATARNDEERRIYIQLYDMLNQVRQVIAPGGRAAR